MGEAIFVQSDDNRVDDYPSLRLRAEGEIDQETWKNEKDFFAAVCEKWIDVRAFGQLFAYKGGKKGQGVSLGIRGPVSVHPAFSIAPVLDRMASLQIVKSVSGEGDGTKKASDTMGMKHRIDHGVYVFYGAINPQLASKTGFSEEDAEQVKEAIKTLFRNDASSARPEGSMEVAIVYWWKHNSKHGQFSSAKVHRSVSTRIRVKEDVVEPQAIEDYDIPSESEVNAALPGLICEVYDYR
jgi:CRISPR-associated protein Csd2